MSTSHLKLYLIIIWAMVVTVLIVGLALWGLTNLSAQPARVTLTPTFSPNPTLTPTPTVAPTIVIIRATPRPGATLAFADTTTPITPQIPFNAIEAPPGIDPLTGLTVADPSRLERRPIAVKVSTWPRSVREVQSGLTRADIVYEYYTENWETRFIAVFYGQDAERAGPVRSGRYFDENIMRMYHSSLVYVSATEHVEDYLLSSADLRAFLFLPRSDNCPPLCKDDSIPSSVGGGYQNTFVNTAGVGAFLADNSKQHLRPTFFNSLFHLTSTKQVSRIFTHYSPYSYNYWEYDPAQKKYLRYSDAKDALDGQEEYAAHIDHLTNQQLTADNVVVLMVPHLFKNSFDREHQVFNIQMIGSGEAYAFIDDKMYQVQWKRDLLDQPIRLFDNANNPLSLKPGVTYYQVVDSESSIKLSGLTMRFNFFIPPQHLTPTPTPPKLTPTPRKHK